MNFSFFTFTANHYFNFVLRQENLLLAMDPASVPHGGNWARPGWWDTISMHGIAAIRKSDFLFVRSANNKSWRFPAISSHEKA